jgi:hypothetical protein
MFLLFSISPYFVMLNYNKSLLNFKKAVGVISYIFFTSLFKPYVCSKDFIHLIILINSFKLQFSHE